MNAKNKHLARRLEHVRERGEMLRARIDHAVYEKRRIERRLMMETAFYLGRGVMAIIATPKRSDQKHLKWLKRRLANV